MDILKLGDVAVARVWILVFNMFLYPSSEIFGCAEGFGVDNSAERFSESNFFVSNFRDAAGHSNAFIELPDLEFRK